MQLLHVCFSIDLNHVSLLFLFCFSSASLVFGGSQRGHESPWNSPHLGVKSCHPAVPGHRSFGRYVHTCPRHQLRPLHLAQVLHGLTLDHHRSARPNQMLMNPCHPRSSSLPCLLPHWNQSQKMTTIPKHHLQQEYQQHSPVHLQQAYQQHPARALCLFGRAFNHLAVVAASARYAPTLDVDLRHASHLQAQISATSR